MPMSPEVLERVQTVQARLEELKVKSIHVCWTETAFALTSDERANALCDFIESYLDGNFTPLPPFGDATEKINTQASGL